MHSINRNQSDHVSILTHNDIPSKFQSLLNMQKNDGGAAPKCGQGIMNY